MAKRAEQLKVSPDDSKQKGRTQCSSTEPAIRWVMRAICAQS